MSESLLDVNNISVRYQTRKALFRRDFFSALESVSFTVHKGETLGVIGPNGCGKSTLLKVLAGIYDVDGGNITWNCSRISLQSLSLGFDQNLSGRDNVIISGMLLGKRKHEVLEELDEIIAFSELKAFIDKPIKTYSSGMRARLGFSVAVRLNAELLLIDEVLGVGDASFKQKAERAMLDKINSKQTVVLVSHSTGQVQKLCDRVLWLNEGKVVMVDKADVVVPLYEEQTGKQPAKRP